MFIIPCMHANPPVVALAIMHHINIDVTFARPFFLLLASRRATWQDSADMDPQFHASCRAIASLAPADMDSDQLGLTFVCWPQQSQRHSRRTDHCKACGTCSVKVDYACACHRHCRCEHCQSSSEQREREGRGGVRESCKVQVEGRDECEAGGECGRQIPVAGNGFEELSLCPGGERLKVRQIVSLTWKRRVAEGGIILSLHPALAHGDPVDVGAVRLSLR